MNLINKSVTKQYVVVLQAQTARNTSWFSMFEEDSPDATTLTVVGLLPFTMYRLRLTARNVVGPSEPSEPTKEFQTIQAPPSHPPRNVTVRAMSHTELRVRWIVSLTVVVTFFLRFRLNLAIPIFIVSNYK